MTTSWIEAARANSEQECDWEDYYRHLDEEAAKKREKYWLPGGKCPCGKTSGCTHPDCDTGRPSF